MPVAVLTQAVLTQALEGQRGARDDAAQTLEARSIPALDAQFACTFTPPTSASEAITQPARYAINQLER